MTKTLPKGSSVAALTFLTNSFTAAFCFAAMPSAPEATKRLLDIISNGTRCSRVTVRNMPYTTRLSYCMSIVIHYVYVVNFISFLLEEVHNTIRGTVTIRVNSHTELL